MKNTIAILVLCSLFVGCNEQSKLPSNASLPELEGKECFVIFRRDALGYSTDKDGISAETVASGASGKLSAKGTLKSATSTWVLLETPEGLQAIPVTSVLSVHEAK